MLFTYKEAGTLQCVLVLHKWSKQKDQTYGGNTV